MAINSSGSPLSFSEIESECGSNNSRRLGNYRVSQTVGSLSNKPLDTGIPQSGPISFSQFYDKRLNVVVDFHSGGQELRQNAKSRYNNNSVTVIGGFRGRKEGGSKILIHVNKTIGSAKGNQANVALRTGSWNSDVVLSVDIGSSGRLYGAGGDGGKGADSWSDGGSQNGGSGGNGTSALGIEHEETAVNVQSGGKIHAGAPGGGGGAGARQVDSGADRSGCGGGGGGGAGLPAGDGGEKGRRRSGEADEVQNGTGGSAGQLEENGEGGAGGNNQNEAIGANGGRGGDFNEGGGEPAQGGNGGKNLDSSNGNAGNNGSAIRRSSGSIQVDITNAGAIHGGTNDIGVA